MRAIDLDAPVTAEPRKLNSKIKMCVKLRFATKCSCQQFKLVLTKLLTLTGETRYQETC